MIDQITIQSPDKNSFVVKKGNLILSQDVTLTDKANVCMVDRGDYYEHVSQFDERFKPLFVALHNYKHGV